MTVIAELTCPSACFTYQAYSAEVADAPGA